MLSRFINELLRVNGVLTPAVMGRYVRCIALSAPEIVRNGKLWPADLRMKNSVRVRYEGASLTIDCGELDKIVPEEGCSSFSNIREMYSRNVYLRCFDTCKIRFENAIDAGGNRGLFTAFASQLCRQVVYVEPQLKYRPCLERLLSDNPTTCTVHVENRLLAGWDNSSTITLDEIIGKYGFPSVGFFKCDIEGAEFDIFAHPGNWISRVDNIAMEVHRAFGDPTLIVDVLQRNGFTIAMADYQLRPVDSRRADYVYASRTGALTTA